MEHIRVQLRVPLFYLSTNFHIFWIWGPLAPVWPSAHIFFINHSTLPPTPPSSPHFNPSQQIWTQVADQIFFKIPLFTFHNNTVFYCSNWELNPSKQRQWFLHLFGGIFCSIPCHTSYFPSFDLEEKVNSSYYPSKSTKDKIASAARNWTNFQILSPKQRQQSLPLLLSPFFFYDWT